MTEESKVGVVYVTGHQRHADWDVLLKEYAVYNVMDSPPGTDITLQYDYCVERHPKNNPITVKGNSRQELVQGKRHSWPTAKKRKGFKS